MGFVNRKKSGNIFAGSRLVVDGQGIYNVKILKFGPERQKSPLEFFRPVVVPQPIPAPLCDFNGIIFMTPTPTPTNTVTPTVTPTLTPTNTVTPTNTPTITPTPSCNCTYIDVTITEEDLNAAVGNTDFDDNGAVYVKHRNCVDGETKIISTRFTVAGVFLNAICGNSGTTPGVTYFANNEQESGSSTAVNNGQCCTPPTPTPTPTNTPTNTVTPTTTLTPTNTQTPTLTPTNTQTPTLTPTNTQTPTLTPTNTQTPTVTPTTPLPIILYTYVTTCNSYYWSVTELTYFDSDEISYVDGNITDILYLTICSGTGNQDDTQTVTAVSSYTWYINGQTYTESGSFSVSVGPCADGGAICTYNLELTIVAPSPTPTPTPTITETPTPTPTETVTPTPTPTQTPTPITSYFTHNFTLCCIDTPITLYSQSSSVILGSYLYTDTSLTTPYYDISVNLIPGAVSCNDPYSNGILTDVTGLVTNITDTGSCN